MKLEQYLLTPIESILINMKMPNGYKLETEENVIKSLEMPKNPNKQKTTVYINIIKIVKKCYDTQKKEKN